MIGSIRNPWVRRPLVVLYTPLYFVLGTVCLILAAIEEFFRDEWLDEMRDGLRLARLAWRGSRRG